MSKYSEILQPKIKKNTQLEKKTATSTNSAGKIKCPHA